MIIIEPLLLIEASSSRSPSFVCFSPTLNEIIPLFLNKKKEKNTGLN